MKKKTVWVLPVILMLSVLGLCTYKITDYLNTDNEAPEILMDEPEIAVSVEDSESAFLQGVTARDDVDGDVTDSLVIESIYGVSENQEATVSPVQDSFTTLPIDIRQDYSVTVTYAAFDQAGNVAKAERRVYYTDYEGPRITISAPLVFEYGSGFDVMSYVGAQDAVDGDISHLVKSTLVSGGSSVTTEGEHEVQFRVTNSLGDSAQLVLPIEVYPAKSYNAELTLKNYIIYLSKDETAASESSEDHDTASEDFNDEVDDSEAFNDEDNDNEAFQEEGSDNDEDSDHDASNTKKFNSKDYLQEFHMMDEVINPQEEIPDNLDMEIRGEVDFAAPGVYPISYTATYRVEEQVYTGYTRLLVVIEG